MSGHTPLEEQQALVIHDLRLRLEEAEDVLAAIRRGEVDALVVKPGARPQIWSINGVDHVYRVLFETLNEGALTLGADAAVLYSNTQFAGLIGRPLQRVLGTALTDYVAESDREVFRMLLERGLWRSSKGEVRLTRPDGILVPVQLSLNAVEVEGFGPTATVVVADLTELKEVQAALAQVNAQLEARVRERTAELQAEIDRREKLERELELRAEQLTEADTRKNEFLAMLGHELRNPLAPILNAVEMLRLRCGEHPEVDRSRAVIERQIRHMGRLVDDLLDVSRISRGTVELRREWVDLRLAVESAALACRPSLEAVNHELSLQLPPTPCWLRGDSTRLEQVVMNLISNACKYTPSGGHIWVMLERHGDWAELIIRDNGRGIPPEMLSQIFELFTQVDTGIDRSLGGLGIGLTVVRNLVELHGGATHAHSDGPGKGSEFLVRLPLAPASQAPRPFAPHLSGEAGPRVRVLVVEDNIDAAETLGELIELWGHEVELAHHGQAALATVARFQPDVVIMDIGLPGLDGYEVARQLRQQAGAGTSASGQDGKNPGPLLIALTGYGQEVDRQRAFAAGFDRHMTKPVNPDQLRALLSGKAG